MNVVVQSLSCVRPFATPWTAVCLVSLSFTISWSLLTFMSIESVTLPSYLILCHPLLLSLESSPASRSFPASQVFTSAIQSTGAPVSASVLPMNIQGWFLLGWIGLISLQSKALKSLLQHHSSKSIKSLALSFPYSPALTSVHDYWRNHTLDCSTFVGKVMSLLFNTLSI